MRVACVEWPDALSTAGAWWRALSESIAALRPDVLVTNELPFGPWLADAAVFSKAEADRSVRAHEEGLEGLVGLGLPAVISSRPVWREGRLANEAFVLENGVARPLHRKQYFPSEPGWYERAWYSGGGPEFAAANILGITVGVLLCTEAMFNEHARSYGRQGASLVVVPRATGTRLAPWKVACAMASLVSGAYVVSSNRVGRTPTGTRFGGGGFAFAPGGRLMASTRAAAPAASIELDPRASKSAQGACPCYVAELE